MTIANATVMTVPPPPSEPLDARFTARDPFTIVIFGASGDLSKRKLLPALFHLQDDGYLPDNFAVVGFSRSEHSDDDFRNMTREDLGKSNISSADSLLQKLHYVPGNNDDLASFKRLDARLSEIEQERGLPGNRLYYLSVAPEFFAMIVKNLSEAKMIRPKGEPIWSRVIIEKPFGRDLKSALALNNEVRAFLGESQVYRIDHYLGKETVQNLFSFRFGNSIFEPLFDRKYVENVQITVGETLGMENKRGGYYDTAGALRDMVENHLLQLLTIIAMEPPSNMDATALRDEKVKVLRALEPMTRKQVAANTVRGQYGPGDRNGEIVKGYRQEAGVNPKSVTESYVAMKLEIDNWRWAGVPFFLRTGKRLKQRVSEIAITFKQPPLHMFRELIDTSGEKARPTSNVLLMRIQPNEGIALTFAAKQPGMQVHLDEVRMDFEYTDFNKRSPEAYERLLLDALRGDASLFTRSDEVEHAWRFVQSILDGWANLPPPKFPNYFPFSDGPDEADRLFEGYPGQGWRPMSEG